jgi:hypothetical protein
MGSAVDGAGLLAGYTGYRPDEDRRIPAVASSTGTGLAVVDVDGSVRWRAYPGRRRMFADSDGDRRLYVRSGLFARAGDVVDLASGERTGRWRLPAGVDLYGLVRREPMRIPFFSFQG